MSKSKELLRTTENYKNCAIEDICAAENLTGHEKAAMVSEILSDVSFQKEGNGPLKMLTKTWTFTAVLKLNSNPSPQTSPLCLKGPEEIKYTQTVITAEHYIYSNVSSIWIHIINAPTLALLAQIEHNLRISAMCEEMIRKHCLTPTT